MNMRIAQIAPMIERVPPKTYGGIERVVYTLTEHLVKRGHDVTLFASRDSNTSAKLVSVYPKGIREAKLKPHVQVSVNILNIANAFRLQEQFDIIHDHTGFGMGFANMAKTPSLLTFHGDFSPEESMAFRVMQRAHFCSISDSQAKLVKNLPNYMGTVYNGLDMEGYPFSKENNGYLLFVGRISQEKGVHHAIDAAKKLRLPLIIAAKVDVNDMPYFTKYVKPRLSRRIKWIGEVDEKARNELMSKAMAFLHPVVWEEPFGLTLIESMACGCPVIAFGRGSIPELIRHNETGFVVPNTSRMIKAIMKVGKIDRQKCRERALKAFNVEKMSIEYEKVFERILNKTSGREVKRHIPSRLRFPKGT